MRVFAIAIFTLFGFISAAHGFAQTDEPLMPQVNQQFSPSKEERINQLEDLTIQEIFQSLGSPEFFSEEEYLNKAIFLGMRHRITDAIGFAMQYIRSVQIQNNAEGMRNMFIAKKVAQIFPDEAMDGLLDLYSKSGPKVRANVIYIVGQMAAGEAPRTLLTEALFDTSVCQNVRPETLGEPLRICDMAYNQLVLRYRIKGVLRTIGSVHKINVRDHHIQRLLNEL